MTLLALLLIGAVVGLLTGALLRRVGLITRLADMGFGLIGAFVVGAMGSGALLQGLDPTYAAFAAAGAAGLVVLIHVASALLRPVHAKYYKRR
ncbi:MULTISPECIES: hypothetical protein [Novosphingobium]|uniref:Putative membrane protein YeaQ/YmgE (Transglycosylase-associated protein family) n=1 Tax=Novosphingobium sediminicola TaxID=563162 RepID=A0A7W6CLV2_9SPHN|nr:MULTISPECIES: hypothetical protein [Novosphingobium]MBB3957034.1 putative membrane protein YeaQ/YmgE (transglycosylase-associated protein family) [Novosphingobium sediminicola]NOW45637.1 putative membrane protein YeaQ/YmgE (transglycosylase-associated protein family) [Novosphingobium sp. SG751A]